MRAAAEKTAAFGHPHADHRNQDCSKRRKAGEVSNRLGDYVLDTLAVEEIDGDDRFAGQRMGNR